MISLCEQTQEVLPYSQKLLDTGEKTDSVRLTVDKKNNTMSFADRMKRSVSLKEIDIKHVRLKMCFYSYLKTVIDIKAKKRKPELIVSEQSYIDVNILALNCFGIKAVNCDSAEIEYKCADKSQKKAMSLSCRLSLFVNYGIIGMLFIPFFATTLDYLINGFDGETNEFVMCLLFSVVTLVALIVYIIKLVKLRTITKDIN